MTALTLTLERPLFEVPPAAQQAAQQIREVIGTVTTGASSATASGVAVGAAVAVALELGFPAPAADGTRTGVETRLQRDTLRAIQTKPDNQLSPFERQLKATFSRVQQSFPGQKFEVVQGTDHNGETVLALRRGETVIPLIEGSVVVSDPVSRVSTTNPSTPNLSTPSSARQAAEADRLEAARLKQQAEQARSQAQATVTAAWSGPVVAHLNKAYGSMGQFERATKPTVQLQGTDRDRNGHSDHFSVETAAQAITRSYESAAQHAFRHNSSAAPAASRMVAFRHPDGPHAPVLVYTGSRAEIARLVKDGVVSHRDLKESGLSFQGLQTPQAPGVTPGKAHPAPRVPGHGTQPSPEWVPPGTNPQRPGHLPRPGTTVAPGRPSAPQPTPQHQSPGAPGEVGTGTTPTPGQLLPRGTPLRQPGRSFPGTHTAPQPPDGLPVTPGRHEPDTTAPPGTQPQTAPPRAPALPQERNPDRPVPGARPQETPQSPAAPGSTVTKPGDATSGPVIGAPAHGPAVPGTQEPVGDSPDTLVGPVAIAGAGTATAAAPSPTPSPTPSPGAAGRAHVDSRSQLNADTSSPEHSPEVEQPQPDGAYNRTAPPGVVAWTVGQGTRVLTFENAEVTPSEIKRVFDRATRPIGEGNDTPFEVLDVMGGSHSKWSRAYSVDTDYDSSLGGAGENRDALDAVSGLPGASIDTVLLTNPRTKDLTLTRDIVATLVAKLKPGGRIIVTGSPRKNNEANFANYTDLLGEDVMVVQYGTKNKPGMHPNFEQRAQAGTISFSTTDGFEIRSRGLSSFVIVKVEK